MVLNMMTKFQHILILYVAARELGMTEKEAIAAVAKYAGIMCVPDVLQYTVKGNGVVGDGYAYTHYTNNCYMVYPAFDDISNFKDIHQTEFQTGDSYNGEITTTPTNFGVFEVMNPNSFQIYDLSINTHFNNDEEMRRVLMDELFYYNYQSKVVYCRKTDMAVPLAQGDILMSYTKDFFNIFFMERIGEFDIEEVLTAVENSFKDLFDLQLAKRAMFNIKETERNLRTRRDKKELLSKLKTLGIITQNSDICMLAWDVFEKAKLNTKVFLNAINLAQDQEQK